MNLFDRFKQILERSLHMKPNQLKHAPFVKPGTEASAVTDANALISVGIDAALAAGPDAALSLLHIKPAQLKKVSGIVDHIAAAEFVNNHIQGALGTTASVPAKIAEPL